MPSARSVSRLRQLAPSAGTIGASSVRQLAPSPGSLVVVFPTLVLFSACLHVIRLRLQAVDQRNELVDMLETERVREKLEDQKLQETMQQKGFELSPVPYSRVTLKRGRAGVAT